MTPLDPSERTSRQFVNALADLSRSGFEVIREPVGSQLPDVLRRFKVDALARRGPELVVLEVLTKGRAPTARLQELADVVSHQPGWRLELLWAGDETTPIPTKDSVAIWLERALLVAEVSIEAATLTAWVGVEGALARLAAKEGLIKVRGPGSRILAELYSRGILSDRQYELLVRTRDARNDMAHGAGSAGHPQVNIDEVIRLASWLAEESFTPTDQMVEEFLTQYEDPANSVPFDSREGGYQYIGNGPFDAYEVLAEKYELADESDIAEAASRLNEESSEWVMKYP